MGAFEDLRERELAEAEQLANRARFIGTAALQASTLAAARAAIEAVATDSGRGTISEPASDLRVLRVDSRLMLALASERMRAEAAALTELIGALEAGYTTEAHGRAAAIQAQAVGLEITVNITEAELRALVDYPIHGHSPRETAKHLVALLLHAFDGVLAAPLTGTIDAAALPSALGDVARLHGDRLGNAVRDAYFAGTQAAEKDIRTALVG